MSDDPTREESTWPAVWAAYKASYGLDWPHHCPADEGLYVLWCDYCPRPQQDSHVEAWRLVLVGRWRAS